MGSMVGLMCVALSIQVGNGGGGGGPPGFFSNRVYLALRKHPHTYVLYPKFHLFI